MSPFSAIWLAIFGALQTVSASSSYTLYNFTWIIRNQAGDIVNTSSSLAPQPQKASLQVDLCQLAAGGDPLWGLATDFLPLVKAPNNSDHYHTVPACDSPWGRTSLWLQQGGYYVCPGAHRPRGLDYKCGLQADYYCASWGCETTGDVSWKPASDKFIQVERLNPPSPENDLNNIPTSVYKACSDPGWCNPLQISIIKADLNDWQTTRKRHWGIRGYFSGKDKGMLFSIELSKESPNRNAAYLGPDPVLRQSKIEGTAPKPKRSAPKLTATPQPSHKKTTPFQPTILPGPPDSSQLIVDLINASLEALRDKNSTAHQECWICFSPIPPFYEGIATLEPPLFTNDSGALLHTQDPFTALTLTSISGLGLCLIGPAMRPPTSLIPICNQTMTINHTFSYVLAASGTYFACSSGLTPYVFTSHFLTSRDYCVVVVLFPRFFLHDPNTFLQFIDPDATSRNKREPLTAITLSVLLGVSAIGAGTGIASLVTSNNQYLQLQSLIDKDLNNLREGIQDLKDSVASLSEVVLQNRRGLDLLFLKEGGLCVALREECCFYSDKTGLVQNSLDKVKKSLENRKRAREQQESWYQNWFSASPWLTTLLPSLLGPFVGIFLLISFGPWAFNRLTTFIKDQVDNAIKRPLEVHYHRLASQEPVDSYNQEPPTAPVGLQFSFLDEEMNLPWYSRIWRFIRRT